MELVAITIILLLLYPIIMSAIWGFKKDPIFWLLLNILATPLVGIPVYIFLWLDFNRKNKEKEGSVTLGIVAIFLGFLIGDSQKK